MKIGSGMLLLLMSGVVLAQAPVEERVVQTPAALQHQQRLEYARGEREKAASQAQQAESELAEAKRAQYDAEKQLHYAKQRTIKAQQELDHARAALRKATEAEERVRRE